MLKTFRTVFTLLLIFGLSAALMGDESEITQYFPGTLGSYWVYVDQDGNELTRHAIEGEEIAGEIYHGFEYEPAVEDWIGYHYHIHSGLSQVGEEGITFLVGAEVEKVVEARLTQEMQDLVRIMMEMAPPEVEAGFELLYDIEVEAPDQFYMLPMNATSNEKWDVAQIKAKVTIRPDPPQGDPNEAILQFTIVEKGKVLEAESVETPAGTFEDCLKIEYRTQTGVAIFPDEAGDEDMNPPGESVTTLWIAPNVGIVKFHQEAEDILLKTIPMPGITTSTTVKILELKQYEIKSADSESDGSD